MITFYIDELLCCLKEVSTGEIYALVLKGTVNIQGMIAVKPNNDMQALELLWACVSPENNVHEHKHKHFSGVGGHLFAIAGDISVKYGYEGFLVGDAMNRDLYHYYINTYHAQPAPHLNNPYRLIFGDKAVSAIMEEYNYEWTESII